LVEEMRRLGAKTQEAARREAVEQSLRVTQLSILREISRTVVGQLDSSAVTEAIINQLHTALGYDLVTIAPDAPPAVPAPLAGSVVITSAIRDAEGPPGWLVVDNPAPRQAGGPRQRGPPGMPLGDPANALRHA